MRMDDYEDRRCKHYLHKISASNERVHPPVIALYPVLCCARDVYCFDESAFPPLIFCYDMHRRIGRINYFLLVYARQYSEGSIWKKNIFIVTCANCFALACSGFVTVHIRFVNTSLFILIEST